MNHTIRHAIVLTQHMTQAVRVKRRLASFQEKRERDSALSGLNSLKEKLHDMLGGSGGFKRVPLIPEPPTKPSSAPKSAPTNTGSSIPTATS